MSTFAEMPKTLELRQPKKPKTSNRTGSEQSSDRHLPHQLFLNIGNQAVKRLMLSPSGPYLNQIPHQADAHSNTQEGLSLNSGVRTGSQASAVVPEVRPTAIEDQGKKGSDLFGGEPMEIPHEGLDESLPPLNEEGLIDGEWTSDVVPHVFVNGGKTGSARVHWAGGSGGRGNQGVGSISLVAPVIETSAPSSAGGTAQAWVRAGTGRATVTRSYTGVLTGANGTSWFITARASARIDRHEVLHVTNSNTHHTTHITPLERRIAQYTGRTNALSRGTTEAAARSALSNILNWNNSVTRFRTADRNDNRPGGTIDTTDSAAADFYRDYGARRVGRVTYTHYVDTPPGP